MTEQKQDYIRWLDDLNLGDVSIVGGKNASLGEMVQALKNRGIRVPDGFATTAQAYRDFIAENGLEARIREQVSLLQQGKRRLDKVGSVIRRWIENGRFSDTLSTRIREAYLELSSRHRTRNLSVAARSSATAEDLPEASFAGQQETFLNVKGADDVLDACRRCYASLFTNRAISYREEKGFDHMEIALSVCIQQMVHCEKGASGVMFTLDTDTGFTGVIGISAAWGLGETVVGGEVNPDEYMVFKPLLEERHYLPVIQRKKGSKELKAVYARSKGAHVKRVKTTRKERGSWVLSNSDTLKLARWGFLIESHYGKPMDIEWARDGAGNLFIVQARPETVQSRKNIGLLKTYTLKKRSKVLVRGAAIGDAIVSGKVRRLDDPREAARFQDHEILVTHRTDPDWGPIMERAAAVVTDQGGRTAHAAIVSRELGIPALVGCDDATRVLKDGQEVTLSCAEGDEGIVYQGLLPYEEKELVLERPPLTHTRIMMNVASPGAAMRWSKMPCDGIGLARIEFIIGNSIKIHPMALLEPRRVRDRSVRRHIQKLTAGYKRMPEYFVEHLAYGIAQIAAAQYPRPVIVRTSDFKTNEYAGLIGGADFEPHESNPMIGFRGASRYHSDHYRKAFALECHAIRRVREEMGLENVIVMIPFCRTPSEADEVLRVMRKEGLRRGRKGLKIYVMVEIPSNVFLAEEFAARFDGLSIGSNDLTQLVLGVDRDSRELRHLFDERNEAVKQAIIEVIDKAHRQGCPVGICGQAPSDHPDFAEFLVRAGIDSISLDPDSIHEVVSRVAKVEALAARKPKQAA